ncbi:MAG: hypothetical protein ACFFDT_14065, partial [Candidatus Hodarchaeota archaeon]
MEPAPKSRLEMAIPSSTRLEPEMSISKRKKGSLEDDLPPFLPDIELSAIEQKIYFQLSIEYQIIINESKNLDEGMYNWNLLLPQRLQTYNLTQDAWNR